MSNSSLFAADWLRLREPIDHSSRAVRLESRLLAALPDRAVLSVLDLGSGSGSNLRHLAPRLERPQRWTLLDHDRDLLDQACQSRPELSDLSLVARCLNLSRIAALDLPRPDLVTASAWLDLVSEDWIDQFAARLETWRVPTLIVLSVDGRRGFLHRSGEVQVDAKDTALQEAFNEHQRVPKGLGRRGALGPGAVRALTDRLSENFEVTPAASDWTLPAGSAAARSLGIELLHGWAESVRDLRSSLDLPSIEPWHNDRKRQIEHGELGLYVGHQDLLALPR